MPKLKSEPWDKEHQNKIRAKRIERGYSTAKEFVDALTDCGLSIGVQTYFGRERGETPTPTDEIWYYSYLLGIPLIEAFALYSRMPDTGEVSLYAKDALKQSRMASSSLCQD